MNSFFQNELLVIFGAIFIGYLVGLISVRGISLGNSACLFVALIFGAFGATVSPIIGNIGIILFVYSVGLQAGPRFFSMFKRRGIRFAIIGLVPPLTAVIVTIIVKYIFNFDITMSSGVMAGAMTSTPALAAAIDTLKTIGIDSTGAASLGYALAYPFGIVGIVLFVQIAPKVFASHEELQAIDKKESKIVMKEFKITNLNLDGKVFKDLNLHELVRSNITRIKHGDMITMITPDTVLHIGDILLAVGEKEELEKFKTILGEEVEARIAKATHIQVRDIFVSNKSIIDKTLRELAITSRFGIVITRLRRNDLEFIPTGDCVLEHGDLIRIVGDVEAVKSFQEFAGANEKSLDETNILLLSLGLVAGVLIGLIPVKIGHVNFKLGLAGGPLFVALLISHFGRIGPYNVRVPNAAKFILRELGLVFFLVGVGVTAGAQLMNIKGGTMLLAILGGAMIKITAISTTFIIAYKFFKFPIDVSLGTVCGGLTSTPALGALTRRFEGTNGPVAYASVYPVALIAITLFSQFFVWLCRACS